MYLMLFNKITDALEADSFEICKRMLIVAQQEAEDFMINQDEEI